MSRKLCCWLGKYLLLLNYPLWVFGDRLFEHSLTLFSCFIFGHTYESPCTNKYWFSYMEVQNIMAAYRTKKMNRRCMTKRADLSQSLYNILKEVFSWKGSFITFFCYFPTFFPFLFHVECALLWHLLPPFFFHGDIRYGRKFFLEFTQRFLLRKTGGVKRL